LRDELVIVTADTPLHTTSFDPSTEEQSTEEQADPSMEEENESSIEEQREREANGAKRKRMSQALEDPSTEEYDIEEAVKEFHLQHVPEPVSASNKSTDEMREMFQLRGRKTLQLPGEQDAYLI
jgi:hypothetical protein